MMIRNSQANFYQELKQRGAEWNYLNLCIALIKLNECKIKINHTK